MLLLLSVGELSVKAAYNVHVETGGSPSVILGSGLCARWLLKLKGELMHVSACPMFSAAWEVKNPKILFHSSLLLTLGSKGDALSSHSASGKEV